MPKKSSLGKGLASLIGSSPSQVNPQVMKNEIHSENQQSVLEKKIEGGPVLIDLSKIVENIYQPRKKFHEKELLELANSIKENGVIQPILVSQSENGYELIAGERRFRASKLAGLDKIPAIIKRVTEREKLVMAIIENVQRAELNCVEEAFAYFQLMDEFKLTQEDVAKKVGKERSTVANFLRVLTLPRAVIDYLKTGSLSFGHAKVLASIKEPGKVLQLAQTAVSKSLSVRELEKLLKVKKEKKESGESHYTEQLDSVRQNLEKKTGFHFHILHKKNGIGEIAIKFNNEAEFNDIYEFLLK